MHCVSAPYSKKGGKALKALQFIKDASGFIIIQKRGKEKEKWVKRPSSAA